MVVELDELESLLLGGSEGAAVPARPGEFRGSMEYIESLPEEPPLSLSLGISAGRDTADIANFAPLLLEEAELPRPMVDNRRFDPTQDVNPGERIRGAARLVDFDPNHDVDPLTGETPEEYKVRVDKLWKRMSDRKNPFSGRSARMQFNQPSWLDICVKRKIRREVMHALGLSGMFYFPRHISPFANVRC